MILDGKCGAFNPVLLRCLTEARDKIKQNIVIKENDHNSYKRNIMKELEEYENTKEYLMQSIAQDIRKECAEIEG